MAENLKVLMISSDRKIFQEGSVVSERMKEYGSLVTVLHIVVLCDRSQHLAKKQLSKNVWAYPTNSNFKVLRHRDAVKIGRTLECNLITTQDPFFCGMAGIKLKRLKNVPLEVQIHTDLGAQDLVRGIMAKHVLKQADQVRDVKDLPIYVDKSKFTKIQHVLSSVFTILCVGRLSREKDFSFALEVFAEVKKRFPKIELFILGSGPQEGRLKKKVQRLRLENSVKFIGWQEDVAEFYERASIFLQTSRFEGYGLALVEAGLSGIPVVTTPVGIARELKAGVDAYIYPIGDKKAFVNGIIDLMQNNLIREELKVNLREFLEKRLQTKEEYLAKIKDNWEKMVR